VGLADYYSAVTDYSPIPASEAAPRGRAAAERAVAMDASLAEAHSALAAAHWNLLEFADAEREFQRALELNPNYAHAHHWYGLFLSWQARDSEAIGQLRRAVELDPLNLQYNANLGQVLGNARQYDASVDQLKKTLEMDPNYAQAHAQLGREYWDMDKVDLWLEGWKKGASLFHDKEELAIAEEVARVYSRSGRKAAVARELEMKMQLARRRYVDPADIAYRYAALGDGKETFACLNKALAEKSGGLQAIKIVRAMDQFHSDRRYIELLKKMGMPQ
jgi:Tfp pilus assembly protein PilF